jgi:hypothetical protein
MTEGRFPCIFSSRAALAARIDAQGGEVVDALDYGITAGWMPEGDEELKDAWSALDEAWAELVPLAKAVENLLPDLELNQ